MQYWGLDQHTRISTVDSVHGEIPVYQPRSRHLLEVFEQSVSRFPDKDALIEEDRRLNYREYRKHVWALAGYLQHHFGIRKGDRVGLLMRNTIEYCVGVFGVLYTGGIAVSINTKLSPQELDYIMNQSGLSVLITDDQLLEKLGDLPAGVKAIRESEVLRLAEVTPQTELIPVDNIAEHDPAFILYTSGTTGRPKGATLTHFNAIHACINYEKCYELDDSDSTIIAVPIFHGTGLFAQLVTFVYLGGTIVLLRTFHALKMLELCEREKVTHTISVPTVFIYLLEEVAKRSFQLRLRKAGVGGAPMMPSLYKKMKNWLPHLHVLNTYGLTEATSPAVIMPMHRADDKIGSIGIPSPVTLAKIVDLKTREELGPNQSGELLLKSPLIIPYYWNNPEGTKKGIIDGWLQTGDIAMRDEEGFLYILDRSKDMINHGGEKVYSVEVENILCAHPSILEAAVIPQPDEKYGEAVKALIVLKQGHQVTEEEVQKWVFQHLAKYKIPKVVQSVDSLPRNAAGKVMKHLLRNQASEFAN